MTKSVGPVLRACRIAACSWQAFFVFLASGMVVEALRESKKAQRLIGKKGQRLITWKLRGQRPEEAYTNATAGNQSGTTDTTSAHFRLPRTVRLFAFGGALHHQRLLTPLNFKICTQIQKSTKPPLTQIMCYARLFSQRICLLKLFTKLKNNITTTANVQMRLKSFCQTIIQVTMIIIGCKINSLKYCK